MSIVTNARLARAKYQAVRRVFGNEESIKESFEKTAHLSGFCSRFQRPRQDIVRIKVNTEEILKRIRIAIITDVKDNCYGESDDEEVCISGVMEMTDEELITTLIHESLHYICYTDRGYGWRSMCTRDEHHAMFLYHRDIQDYPTCVSCIETTDCDCC